MYNYSSDFKGIFIASIIANSNTLLSLSYPIIPFNLSFNSSHLLYVSLVTFTFIVLLNSVSLKVSLKSSVSYCSQSKSVSLEKLSISISLYGNVFIKSFKSNSSVNSLTLSASAMLSVSNLVSLVSIAILMACA